MVAVCYYLTSAELHPLAQPPGRRLQAQLGRRRSRQWAASWCVSLLLFFGLSLLQFFSLSFLLFFGVSLHFLFEMEMQRQEAHAEKGQAEKDHAEKDAAAPALLLPLAVRRRHPHILLPL